MSDGIVAFDLARFSLLPGRLARIAGDLEDAARAFARTDHPAGARAAAAVDEVAAWARRQQVLVADRWARIEAIPFVGSFHQWDGSDRRYEWSTWWLTRREDGMHTDATLAALGAAWHVVRPVVDAVERGEELDPEDVDAAVAVLASAAEEPAAAAALLGVLGADGYRALHAAVAATAGAMDDDEDVRRLEEEIGVLTATFAAATRAVGEHRLDPAFVDDLLGPAEPVGAHGPAAAGAVDAAQQAFAALDFGRDVAERLAAATGRQGAVLVLERAGAPFAVLTAAMPLVELVQHGPLSEEFAESAITTTLSLASFLAEGALASIGFLALGALVALVFATADDAGTPRRPTRGGAQPGGPGTGTADLHLDDHGVPVAPNGA